jgi:hypothetical protein
MTVQPTTHTPPSRGRTVPESALQLDSSVNMVDLARTDINRVLQTLPADTPLFSCVDLVTAVGYLKQAAILIDRVADQLEVEAVR